MILELKCERQMMLIFKDVNLGNALAAGRAGYVPTVHENLAPNCSSRGPVILILCTKYECRFFRKTLEPRMEYVESIYQFPGLYTLCVTSRKGRWPALLQIARLFVHLQSLDALLCLPDDSIRPFGMDISKKE